MAGIAPGKDKLLQLWVGGKGKSIVAGGGISIYPRSLHKCESCCFIALQGWIDIPFPIIFYISSSICTCKYRKAKMIFIPCTNCIYIFTSSHRHIFSSFHHCRHADRKIVAFSLLPIAFSKPKIHVMEKQITIKTTSTKKRKLKNRMSV